MKPLIELIVSRLSETLREEYEERAAIMQYEGNLSQEDAEYLALLDVLRRHPEVTCG